MSQAATTAAGPEGRIPVLDIAPFLRGEAGAMRHLARSIARSCEDTGFLVLANHGIPQALSDGCFAAAAQFFALPDEEKLALKVGALNLGFLPTGAQVIRTSKVNHNTKPNLNESFYISRDYAPDDPDILAGKPFIGLNRWPPALPEFRVATMAYYTAMQALAQRMLPAFAVALDLPPDYFAADFAEPSCTLRLIRYQPQPEPEANRFGFAPHIDTNFIDLPGAIGAAGAGGADPRGPVAAAAGHPRHLRGQYRRDARPLFQRPLRADAAPRGEQQQPDALRHPVLLRPGQ